MTAEGVVVVDPDGDAAHFQRGHPESPERLVVMRKALAKLDSPRITFASAGPATKLDVESVHFLNHVEDIEDRCALGEGSIDPDTYYTEHTFEIALLAAGTALAAVDVAAEGKHAFALTRPGGHHATAGQAMGFCFFNNVAIAAAHARRTDLAEKIAIIDIDVHQGNGTEAIVRGDPTTLFVSLHQSPFYPWTGETHSSLGNICNIPLPMGTDERSWLEAFDTKALPRIEAFAPELILVSCGFDTLETDPLADFKLTPETFTEITQRIVGLTDRPTVWCVEGGYDPEGGAKAATAVVDTLAQRTVQMRGPVQQSQVT